MNNTSIKRRLEVSTSSSNRAKKRKAGLLSDIRCKTVNFTPRKKKMYYAYRKQTVQICKLKNYLTNSRDKLKSVYNLTTTNFFNDLDKSLQTPGANFIKSQFINCKREKPTWTLENKVFALAIGI